MNQTNAQAHGIYPPAAARVGSPVEAALFGGRAWIDAGVTAF